MSTSEHAPPQPAESWAGTADEWAGKVHNAELPSGMRVSFRFPSLGEMIELEALPADLLEIAVAEWAEPGAAAQLAAQPYAELAEQDEEPTEEQREQADEHARAISEKVARLNRHLVARALVAPRLTIEELARAPYSDLEMLARLINRLDPFDAAGRRIGPEPITTFLVFAEEHECAPGCPACETARGRLSTVQ